MAKDFSKSLKQFFMQFYNAFLSYLWDLSHLWQQYFKTNSKAQIAKDLLDFVLEIAFWGFVAFMLLISSFASGQWMKYDDGIGQHHDHHLAFFTFLAGMVANGHLSGIRLLLATLGFYPHCSWDFFKDFWY